MRSPCDSGSLAGRNGSASKVWPRRPRRVAGAQQRQVVQDVELQDDCSGASRPSAVT